MNAGMKALLIENLKKLKLSTMLRDLESMIRQANQESLSYEEFLLNLSESEVQTRQENGRKRRLREAKFSILKPMEIFDFDAAPGLDIRLMKELSNCDYIKKKPQYNFCWEKRYRENTSIHRFGHGGLQAGNSVPLCHRLRSCQ